MDSNTQLKENQMNSDEKNKFMKSFETQVIREKLDFDSNVCRLFQPDENLLKNLDPHDVFRGTNSAEDICVFKFDSMPDDSSKIHQKSHHHFIPIQSSDEIHGFYAQNGNSSISGEVYNVKIDATKECLHHLTKSNEKFDIEMGGQDELDQKYPSTSISLEIADLKSDSSCFSFEASQDQAHECNQKIKGSQKRINLSKKSQMKRAGLALRADVMNKNMFRAFRRECKVLFTKFMKREDLNISRSKRSFKANIIKFSENILEETSINCKSRLGFECSDFTKYLSLFVNLCAAKKHLTDPADLLKVSKFSDVLYSYSHKRLFEFLKVPEVSTLFKIIFYEKVCIDDFTLKHPTLSLNSIKYKEHIQATMKEI